MTPRSRTGRLRGISITGLARRGLRGHAVPRVGRPRPQCPAYSGYPFRGATDQSTPEFLQTGQEILKSIVQNMYYIDMMNIPTTIPTNETYWTNFPKGENGYAVPYTWWSSFKKILVNIKPTGQ
jgi:hypothetical protein